MTKKEMALTVIERLKAEYPDAGCTLDYNEAWKLLVSVRLAAQCTDARVNVVVEDLYKKFPDVDALAAATPEEIEAIVKPCGLGKSKARDISACMKILKEQCAISVENLIDELDKRGKTVMFLGDGVPAYREIIDEKMKTEHLYAPCHMNRQRASSLAALAQIYYKNGKIEEASEHRPDYLRLSQAEREMLEKQKKEEK